MSRHVLVTGAGNGIGAATAKAFGAAGDHVIVTDLDEAAADLVAEEIALVGGSASAHHLDVSDPSAWQRLAAQLAAERRLPGVVVNNAFHRVVRQAHELDELDWNAQLSASLGGVYRSVRTFHQSLAAARGSIVNVASVHAVLGFPAHPAYAAAKGGVVALTRQLAYDYAPAIRVNSVLPGSISTRVWDGCDEGYLRTAAEAAMLKRFGSPDEVANAILFLAGEGASYITGAALTVDGGLTVSGFE